MLDERDYDWRELRTDTPENLRKMISAAVFTQFGMEGQVGGDALADLILKIANIAVVNELLGCVELANGEVIEGKEAEIEIDGVLPEIINAIHNDACEDISALLAERAEQRVSWFLDDIPQDHS